MRKGCSGEKTGDALGQVMHRGGLPPPQLEDKGLRGQPQISILWVSARVTTWTHSCPIPIRGLQRGAPCLDSCPGTPRPAFMAMVGHLGMVRLLGAGASCYQRDTGKSGMHPGAHYKEPQKSFSGLRSSSQPPPAVTRPPP